MRSAVVDRWPHLLLSALGQGARGVQIFFVISGFVIAHSLARTVPNWRTAGNFALRRQVRLDPPYWCAVALALMVSLAFPAVMASPASRPLQIPLNIVYLQGVWTDTIILDVSWTLCLEVQFYLALIGILWLTHGLRLPSIAAPLVVLALAACSLLHFESRFCPWFVPNWPYFAGGALAYWMWQRKCPRWLLALHLAILVILATRFSWPPFVVGVATIVGVWACAEAGKLPVWTFGRVAQYFGRISYSLYLVHSTIIVAVLNVGYRMTGDHTWSILLWWCAATLGSIAVAHLLWRFVESPSTRFASNLKRSSGPHLAHFPCASQHPTATLHPERAVIGEGEPSAVATEV